MRYFNLLIVFCLVFLMSGAVMAGEKAPAKVYEMAKDSLAAMGRDPIIVKAVKEKNARGESPDQVKAMDEKWKNTPGMADFMKEYMENECGQYLAKMLKQSPYFAEIFVMDQNGAIAAMSDKTSDYWQGTKPNSSIHTRMGPGPYLWMKWNLTTAVRSTWCRCPYR